MKYTIQSDSTVRRRNVIPILYDGHNDSKDDDLHLTACDGPADDVDSDESHAQEKIMFPKVRKNKFPFLRTLT